MEFELAQLNLARFRLPMEHPTNAPFVDNLDRVNAIAETQPGFVWRLTGAGNNALDVQAFDDPAVAVNLSVWSDLASLTTFVYRNEAHLEIMRRRKEWFEKMQFYLVLWWVKKGQVPSVAEAKDKLAGLTEQGPSAAAFDFSHPFPAPRSAQSFD